MPPELSEPSDEYEEQEFFVPADIDQHQLDSPETARREYLARRLSHERHSSSDIETEKYRETEVRTPTPHSHGRPTNLGTQPHPMLSPTPTRAFMNGDSAPHS